MDRIYPNYPVLLGIPRVAERHSGKRFQSYFLNKGGCFDDLTFEKFEKSEKRGSFQNGTIPVFQRLTTPFFLTKATVRATNAFEKTNLAGLFCFGISFVYQHLTPSKIIIHEKFVSNS